MGSSSSSILKAKQDRQQEYGLTGDFDPERDLFREFQGVKEVAEYNDEELTPPILDELNKMRKIPGQKGVWCDVQTYLPNDQSKSLGQRFWAVLIGNNKYNDARELYGCINDTELIRGYLLDRVGVPDDHIRLLHNASREAIIGALYDLRDNTDIQIGDNILIHFSGHGSIYNTKSFVERGVSSVGSIGAICPSDRSGKIPASDISYRELNHILFEVQKTKGGNVTFIIDCCYSGAVAGANFVLNGLSMEPVRSMLEAAKRHPRRNWSISASSEDWKEGYVSSFVQLVACQDDQKAKEVTLKNGDKYGVFTWALINALESAGPESTYEDVIRNIGRLEGGQVPTVVGVRRESRLWFR